MRHKRLDNAKKTGLFSPPAKRVKKNLINMKPKSHTFYDTNRDN